MEWIEIIALSIGGLGLMGIGSILTFIFLISKSERKDSKKEIDDVFGH